MNASSDSARMYSPFMWVSLATSKNAGAWWAAMRDLGCKGCATKRFLYHSDSARLDAEVLLCKILGLNRSGLIARGTDPMTAASREAYAALLARRRAFQQE